MSQLFLIQDIANSILFSIRLEIKSSKAAPYSNNRATHVKLFPGTMLNLSIAILFMQWSVSCPLLSSFALFVSYLVLLALKSPTGEAVNKEI